MIFPYKVKIYIIGMDSGGFQHSWKRRTEQLARDLLLFNYFESVTVTSNGVGGSTVHFTCFKQLYKKIVQTPPTPPFCTSVEKSTLH